MKTILAYCGLKCDSCPIFLTTFESDSSLQQSMRKSVAETINSLYGLNFNSEDITDCEGCKTNTIRIFKGCLNCAVRACAKSNKVENCAYCTDYPCEILKKKLFGRTGIKKKAGRNTKVILQKT